MTTVQVTAERATQCLRNEPTAKLYDLCQEVHEPDELGNPPDKGASLVATVLADPEVIYEGLLRANQDHGRCYVRKVKYCWRNDEEEEKPVFDAWEKPRPFGVFVNAEGHIMDWRRLPDDILQAWGSRFREEVWTR